MTYIDLVWAWLERNGGQLSATASDAHGTHERGAAATEVTSLSPSPIYLDQAVSAGSATHRRAAASMRSSGGSTKRMASSWYAGLSPRTRSRRSTIVSQRYAGEKWR